MGSGGIFDETEAQEEQEKARREAEEAKEKVLRTFASPVLPGMFRTKHFCLNSQGTALPCPAVYLYVDLYVCISVFLHISYIYTCIYIYMCTYRSIYIYIYVCI